MAVLDFGTNDDHTVKVWSEKLNREILPKTIVGKFIGDGPSAVVQKLDELSRGSGDTVYCNLEYLISGDGVTEGQTLEGNEQRQNFYRDAISINELAQAMRWYTRMANQRVVFKFRDSARAQLSDWFADRLDATFLNHVCGNTVQTNTKYTGYNATLAPSSSHQIWQGTASADEGLGTSDTFTLSILDDAITVAKTMHDVNGLPILRPVRIAGGEFFPVILHSHQVRDLKKDTGSGGWQDIQKHAMAGGAISDNPIFTGALGTYNGCILFESTRVPLGCDSGTPTTAVANTRRAVMLGAQSAGIAYGREGGRMERYLWNEESFDFGRENAISAALIFGMKKLRFNSNDFGTLVLSTYAAA
jgi:N4-gp56 family major capsid protein